MKFVPLLTAWSITEALRVRMLLDRARVHYLVKNEGVQNLIGGGAGLGGYNPATGPIEFHVLESDKAWLEEAMEDLFNVHLEGIPEICPACEARTQHKVDCPSCGLFLG